MAIIAWAESSPADGDSAGLGDDQIRSLKTSVRVGLDTEHVWPSGGGDAGVHRMGSARPYYGAQSLVSSSGSDARLMQTSDSSRLFGVGSGGTVFYGGPTVISMGTFPGGVAPQRHIWVEEVGAITNATSSDAISFSAYSGKPYVFTSAYSEGGSAVFTTVVLTGATLATVNSHYINAGSGLLASASGHTVFWRSLGTRVL